MHPKSVIVTGGASGIGLAMTRYFASRGDMVAMLDVNAAEGSRVIAEVASEYPNATLSFKQCDVTSWEQQAAAFKQVYAEHGDRIDVVMANAGLSDSATSRLIDLEEAEPSEPGLRPINVNLKGVIYSIKLAIHYMNRKPMDADGKSRGTIICTASQAGIYAFPVAPLYGASKFGVVGLVRSMALPLLQHNIQINALAPAVLETNIAPDRSLFRNMILTPMSTLVTAVDNFVLDPKATGVVVEVHGDKCTVREASRYVDADSEKNWDTFWSLQIA